MTGATADWEQRIADLWRSFDDRTEEDFLARIKELVAQLPANNAAALFEQACAFDSTGHSDLAVPLYQHALRLGLTGVRRRRAVIQLASSLRNLDRAPESVALLTAELSEPSDELDDAVRATLALALVDTGREREAVALALTALARHLPRYQRSMTNYARMLVDEPAVGKRPSGPDGESPAVGSLGSQGAAIAHLDVSRITSWHAHVYFDAASRDSAKEFRDVVVAQFGTKVQMGRFHERAVGPHPRWSYQIAFAPTEFSTVVGWLALNHGALDVLVHPNTGNELRDHRDCALWLGRSHHLDLRAVGG